ncbi:MAG: cupin domain-containing protein [Lachnospiraceae bacterium]|jgi:cupin domain protein|nr:MAG: cupin domain-containing protein [Lachnospiraceae bacterium]
MSKIIKNFPVEEVTNLAGQVNIQEGQIVSKTLAQNKHVSITIFAFDKDEEISTHDSDGDAMVNVLEGKGKFVIDGKEYIVNAGESIIMPSRKPHSVYAIEQFKMMLVVVFPS